MPYGKEAHHAHNNTRKIPHIFDSSSLRIKSLKKKSIITSRGKEKNSRSNFAVDCCLMDVLLLGRNLGAGLLL